MLDFVAILATIMLIKAGGGGRGCFRKCANAAAERLYLEVTEKQKLFRPHSTLAGEGRRSNCTIRFLQHNAWLGPDDVYRTLAPTL